MITNIYNIKSYSFKGDLDVEHRTEILAALGLPLDYTEVLQIEGDYSVDWDDDIAMPYATSCFILHPTNEGTYLNYEDFAHLDDLGEKIEAASDFTDQGNWDADRRAAAADYAYDSYYDR